MKCSKAISQMNPFLLVEVDDDGVNISADWSGPDNLALFAQAIALLHKGRLGDLILNAIAENKDTRGSAAILEIVRGVMGRGPGSPVVDPEVAMKLLTRGH